ncbi:MAG: flavodoxin family protein [Eubacteriales bacterium]|nr:flavodoxin family protein [Eubacteriales bacterium]
MNVLLINGSPHANGCTATALRQVSDTLHTYGITTELYQLGTAPISGCLACRSCSKTGRCAIDDGVNRLLDAMQTYDALIVGSPVYYAGPAGQLCAFLDRLFYASGGRMAGKPAACIVSCRRGGASAAFDRLNKYFTINSMPVVSSQYWNQVHGSTAEQVLQDAEGMQTMRTLAHNLAWMLQNIAAGRKEGVSFPEAREPRLRTDFIRS